MHVDIHDVTHATCRQLGASINLTFSAPDGEVTLYLPEKMLACATMIVGAFNAHMSGETVAEGGARLAREADAGLKDLGAIGPLQYNPAEHWPNKPLTIEGGKYYRTRDGRKVGPMLQVKVGPDRFYGNGFSGLAIRTVGLDGKWNYGPHISIHDLIAEWPGTPSESDERASAERM